MIDKLSKKYPSATQDFLHWYYNQGFKGNLFEQHTLQLGLIFISFLMEHDIYCYLDREDDYECAMRGVVEIEREDGVEMVTLEYKEDFTETITDLIDKGFSLYK